jgi:transcriptional regulator of heat shock response
LKNTRYKLSRVEISLPQACGEGKTIRILECQAMQQKKKLRIRMDDLKKELNKIYGEIFWRNEQIDRLLDYAQTNKLKREIQELKQQQVLLLKDLEQRTKLRSLIRSRRSLKTISFRSGGRTKMM